MKLRYLTLEDVYIYSLSDDIFELNYDIVNYCDEYLNKVRNTFEPFDFQFLVEAYIDFRLPNFFISTFLFLDK